MDSPSSLGYDGPCLIPPGLEMRLRQTYAASPKQDYWSPAKSTASSFYQRYIKPHYLIVIFIVIILLILVMRYFWVRQNRKVAAIAAASGLQPAPVVNEADTMRGMLKNLNGVNENEVRRRLFAQDIARSDRSDSTRQASDFSEQ